MSSTNVEESAALANAAIMSNLSCFFCVLVFVLTSLCKLCEKLCNFHHNFLCVIFSRADSHLDVTRYSSEEMSGNESKPMTEVDRQAEMNRHKEEMKRKRRRKKRTSSSLQSSCFQGESVKNFPNS